MPDRPLTVMNLLSEEGRGGSDRISLDLSIGLKRRGHRVIFGAPSHCILNQEAADAGVEVFEIFPLDSRDSDSLPGFMRFCRENRVDIVNAHHSRSRHLLLNARLRGLRSKAVFSRHCILRTMPFLGAFFYNFVVAVNIAMSEVIRKSLIRSGILPSRAVTVHGGINLDRFREAAEEKVREVRAAYVREGSVAVGMVARMQHAGAFNPAKPTLKGHEVLFQALNRLPVDFTLLLLGPWERHDIANLTTLAQYHGLDASRISFCGFQQEMAAFYRAMDINVLPSPDEGLGLAVIEGMAAGIPSVGADAGGLAEVITDGRDGLLFRPGDSRDLADKMRAIIDSRPLRERLVAGGRETAGKRFGADRMAEETERVFYSLLS